MSESPVNCNQALNLDIFLNNSQESLDKDTLDKAKLIKCYGKDVQYLYC